MKDIVQSEHFELDVTGSYGGKDIRVARLHREPSAAEMGELKARGYQGFEWASGETQPPAGYHPREEANEPIPAGFKFAAVVLVIVACVVSFLLVSCSEAQALSNTQYSLATATQAPTRTPVPSATIGYEQTAMVAQATADEARRVNAQATTEHESILLGQSQLTAGAENNALVMLQLTAQWEGITATAAFTSIPLTATQQAINNTQIPAAQTLQAVQLDATLQAPTQYVAMQQAINYQRYGGIDYFARWTMYGVIAVFVLALVAWILRNPVLPRPDPVPVAPVEFAVNYTKRENGGYKMTRFVVPCAPEQLTELARGIVDGSKTWAINQWETHDTGFTRSVILRVRAWARDNKFVLATANDELVTTDEGTDFLIDWLDARRLPDNYAFEAENADTPNAVVDIATE